MTHDISALEALLKEATPGPWRKDPWVAEVGPCHELDTQVFSASLPRDLRWPGDAPDAALIVAMRNALPEILEERKRLREALTLSTEVLIGACAAFDTSCEVCRGKGNAADPENHRRYCTVREAMLKASAALASEGDGRG